MKKSKGFGLAEMLIAMLIVMVLAYLYVKLVWKNSGVSDQTRKAMDQSGIKVGKPQEIVQHAQDTVNQLNKETEKLQKQYGEGH